MPRLKGRHQQQSVGDIRDIPVPFLVRKDHELCDTVAEWIEDHNESLEGPREVPNSESRQLDKRDDPCWATPEQQRELQQKGYDPDIGEKPWPQFTSQSIGVTVESTTTTSSTNSRTDPPAVPISISSEQSAPNPSISSSSPEPTSSTTTLEPQNENNGYFAKPNGTDGPDGKDLSKDGMEPGHVVMAVLGPLIFMVCLAALAFWWFRRQSRQDRAHAPSRAMKMTEDAGYAAVSHAESRSPQPVPGAAPAPLHSQPEISNIPAIPLQRPLSVQPIILGPMNQSGTGNYYTGLEADTVSLSDANNHTNPPYAMVEDPDEPPPPYRPRSVVSFVSREASIRQSSINQIREADESTQNLIPAQSLRPTRSPFADPEDDAVSLMSEARPVSQRRDIDSMSEVSDLSYQNSIRRS